MRTRHLPLLFSSVLALSGCALTGPVGPLPVVGGTVEPDYRYPWVIGPFGCHGVLIHPQWVLTAAHCAIPAAIPDKLSYRRTDPYTGTVFTTERGRAGQGFNHGVFLHPKFNIPSALDNDIALVKLAQPFDITPYIQTAALPATPRTAGTVGTVASKKSHTMPIPDDKVAIFRAPIPQETGSDVFSIFTTATTASLCPGDSGSAFVTYENGRATVRGITSQVNTTSDCVTPAGNQVQFMDVFAYRDWILETIRTVDYRLAGTTRVRWTGRASRGVMGLGCVNPDGTMWGPLNVPGVELGANCEPNQTQAIVCSLSDVQAGPLQLAITGFTMKTDCPPFPTSVQSLPFTATWASFSGLAPVHPDPVGVCLRQFTCTVSPTNFFDFGTSGVLIQ